MKTVLGPWRIDRDLPCPPPDFKRHSHAHFSLRGKIKGISGGILEYRFRNLLQDKDSSDDRIYIEFRTDKFDLFSVLKSIKMYINEFDAYEMYMYPEELIYERDKVPFEIRKNINLRKDLDYFYPFLFMDHLLTEKIFKYEPLDLCVKLKNEVNHIELLNQGVFIQGFDHFATLSEMLAFNEKMENVLGVTFPLIS